MRCIALASSYLIALSATTMAVCQNGFPSPAFALHDSTNQNKQSGVKVSGNQITIASGIGTPTTINVISFSDDGKMIAAGKDFGRVVIWRTEDYSLVRVIDTGKGIVGALSLSPDGSVIATGKFGGDNEIQFWNTASGKLLRKITLPEGVVRSLEYISNQTILVNANGRNFVLDTVSGKPAYDLGKDHLIILSDDKKQTVSASDDKFVFRDAADGTVVNSIPKPAVNAWPLAYSVEAKLLVYGTFFKAPGFHAMLLGDTTTALKDTPELPQFNPSAGYFVSVDAASHTVWLHSDARAIAWSPETGKSCQTAVLYSESGALSRASGLVASGLDNGILSKDKVDPGVLVWKISDVLKSCKLR